MKHIIEKAICDYLGNDDFVADNIESIEEASEAAADALLETCPNLMNLLSLPFVVAGNPLLYDEDADADINLNELILEARKELGI